MPGTTIVGIHDGVGRDAHGFAALCVVVDDAAAGAVCTERVSRPPLSSSVVSRLNSSSVC